MPSRILGHHVLGVARDEVLGRGGGLRELAPVHLVEDEDGARDLEAAVACDNLLERRGAGRRIAEAELHDRGLGAPPGGGALARGRRLVERDDLVLLPCGEKGARQERDQFGVLGMRVRHGPQRLDGGVCVAHAHRAPREQAAGGHIVRLPADETLQVVDRQIVLADFELDRAEDVVAVGQCVEHAADAGQCLVGPGEIAAPCQQQALEEKRRQARRREFQCGIHVLLRLVIAVGVDEDGSAADE